MMLANISGAMELKLDEFEAKQLAENLVEISKFYPLLQASEKAQAWCNLIIVIGVIYGSRIIAIRNRLSQEPMRNVTPTVIAQPAAQQTAPAAPRANGSGPVRPNNPPRPATEGFEWVFVPGANQWVEQPRGGFTHIIN